MADLQSLVSVAALLLLALPAAGTLHAQQASAHTPPYTVVTSVRRVITDVAVMDSSGRPVTGLKQSDFDIYEDKQPQAIRSFDEQQQAQTPLAVPASLPQGAYSNVALQDLPPTTDVILIDPFNSRTDFQKAIEDQMYLRIQLLQVVKQLAGKNAVAVFAINSGYATVPLQTFTSDPALLRAAINRELPRVTGNGGNLPQHFADAFGALSTISTYLSRIPGHKNLIWFSSYFPFTEEPEGMVDGFDAVDKAELNHLYNQLSLDRVSIFPVDIKGLEIAAAPPIGEQTAMDGIAAATGGKAFYSSNDLGQAAVDAVRDGSNYYTLTYAPPDYVADDKFHAIHVEVTAQGGPYTLLYRSGYVAFRTSDDASQKLNANQLSRTNAALDTLAAGGRLQKTSDQSSLASLTNYNEPAQQAAILFEAKIVPASEVPGWQVLPPAVDAKGHAIGNPHDAPYVIEYAALSKDLRFVPTPAGKEHAELVTAAVAYTEDGLVLDTAVDRTQINFSPDQMQLADRIGTPLRQQIRLPKKKLFVALSLIDSITGRTGSLEIPFSPGQP